jgi:hypothetical protein
LFVCSFVCDRVLLYVAQASLKLQGSSDPPVSTSPVAGTAVACHPSSISESFLLGHPILLLNPSQMPPAPGTSSTLYPHTPALISSFFLACLSEQEGAHMATTGLGIRQAGFNSHLCQVISCMILGQSLTLPWSTSAGLPPGACKTMHVLPLNTKYTLNQAHSCLPLHISFVLRHSLLYL